MSSDIFSFANRSYAIVQLDLRFSGCDIATARIAKHLQMSVPSFSKEVLFVRPIDQHIDLVMRTHVHKGIY